MTVPPINLFPGSEEDPRRQLERRMRMLERMYKEQQKKYYDRTAKRLFNSVFPPDIKPVEFAEQVLLWVELLKEGYPGPSGLDWRAITLGQLADPVEEDADDVLTNVGEQGIPHFDSTVSPSEDRGLPWYFLRHLLFADDKKQKLPKRERPTDRQTGPLQPQEPDVSGNEPDTAG
ncbi:hypothetical protein EI42_04510 [Thermosporothrix hazakensis]|uniref:Uncharacterized protein n=1 Tax=Thermosporothrix hazakensis TaxID=644383 RepID=A0A326UEG7_THEHA|nr:hypothetical protein [Thermosporothrix hazakensis]PZW24902.1 hypothetical protein EI42_04510 [Thermosporothrix hazakensis]GCE46411.1 hypothetical protein KTH_12800 [Thermosporothrix hazakensis]